MWHLIEDFFEQNLVMKGFIGLGWLCVIIMVFSLGDHVWREYKTASESAAAEEAAALVTPAKRFIG